MSPSLSSSASNSPVDAPLGAVPLPTVPSTKVTSASTVGLPLESKISRPTTFSISKKFIVTLSPFPQNNSTPRKNFIQFCIGCVQDSQPNTRSPHDLFTFWLVLSNLFYITEFWSKNQ